MNIVLVEDDHLQADSLNRILTASFEDVAVQVIATESEFRERFDQIVQRPPDLVIMDVMVRWANPQVDMPEMPPDVRDGTFRRAGFRCLRMLSGRQETAQVPVIVHTVVEREELKDRPPHVLFLMKSNEVAPLILRIRSVVADCPREKRLNWHQRILDAFKAEPGAFGFTLDVKKLAGGRSLSE